MLRHRSVHKASNTRLYLEFFTTWACPLLLLWKINLCNSHITLNDRVSNDGLFISLVQCATTNTFVILLPLGVTLFCRDLYTVMCSPTFHPGTISPTPSAGEHPPQFAKSLAKKQPYSSGQGEI